MIPTTITRQLARRPLGARLTAGCLGRLAHRRTIAGRYDDATELAHVGLDIAGPHRTDRRVLLVTARLHGHAAVAATLGGRPAAAAEALRAALKALESAGRVDHTERALRDLGRALADLTAIRRDAVVVTTRTTRAPARCDAPNCAGHRTRA